MRFSGEASTRGTAVVVDLHGQRFLLTAKHLCIDEPEEQVTLAHPWTNDGAPMVTVLERVGRRDSPGDVALFRLPSGLLSDAVGTVDVLSAGYFITQECFILGYPYGLALTFSEASNVQLPLVKRGIIAGASGPPSDRVLYLDLVANPGFSGGPVVIRNGTTGRQQVIAVVKGTLTGPLVEPTLAEPSPPRVTAGLSLATEVDSALRLLGLG